MISDLLPHLAELADEMCFLHSMTSKTPTHGPGECFMSTGFVGEGYPSMGAWVSYALVSESDNLPAYVAIPDPRGIPQQGPSNWTNGFLPAAFQGTGLGDADKLVSEDAAKPHVSLDQLEVGLADAGPCHPNEHFAFARSGRGKLRLVR